MNQLLQLIQDSINNTNVSDTEFRNMIKGAMEGVIIDSNNSIPLKAPLLYAQDANILCVYLHNKAIFNDLERVLSVFKVGYERNAVIMDLTGYDEDTFEYAGLADLLGEENAQQLIGELIQFICIEKIKS